MNHHIRSYSEQPLIGSGSQIINGLAQQPQPQARILNHSDSQQSLDRLFNPTMTSSVPLRDRNLPSSFFNPIVKTDNGTNGTAPTNGNHIQGNNLHNRSISFDHRNQNVPQPRRQNFHLRTHSTLAPMPQLDSNHSSHHTSREFLNTTNPNTPNSNNNNNNSNNVSLCQQHSENIVSSTSTNNHNHNQQQQQQQRNLHQHSHSNGWSSAGNSIDDLSSPSWVASPQEPPAVMATNQPMQVVQQHQPTSMHEHVVPIQPHHHNHQQQQHQMTTNMVANNHQSMFYNAAQQTVAAADTTTTPAAVAPNHVCSNQSLHARSSSYHQQRPVTGAAIAGMSLNHGFHQRTHSTIAPMTSTCHHHHHHQQATSHHSSHQSSQEVLNHSSATNSSAAAAWSSSEFITDDMTGAGAGHSWGQGSHLHHHPSQPQLHITQQPLPQPPTQMDHHQPSNGAPLGGPPLGHNHNHHHHQHHHHHIPLQVQQQTAHPIAPQQQLFYNV